MVKREKVKKWLVIYAFMFIILSIVELIASILLVMTELDFDGEKVLVSELLLNQSLMPLDGLVAWIYLLASIGLYIILGLVLLQVNKKDSIEDMLLAKHIIILGMLLFIMTFIKLEYIVILANQRVMLAHEPTFQNALYDADIAPYPMTGLIWMTYQFVASVYFVMIIIFTASGLKWVLDMEALKESNTTPNPE